MRNKKGFTMLEVILVLAVIALLAAISVPNFLRAQKDIKTNTCIYHLKQMDEAIDRFAASNKKTPTDPVYFTDIVPAFLKAKPRCPAGGTYTLTTVSEDPSCSIEGHELP